MQLPFTVEQFFDVFRQYNERVWPAQLFLLAAATIALLLTVRPGERAGRSVSGILALLWLWMGVIYHIGFFRDINPAAVLFGALSIVQALLLTWLGVREGRLTFRSHGAAHVWGWVHIGYALLLYPLLGAWLGHRYPLAPTFGLPCPTTIFTFGIFLWARPPIPRALVVIPGLWAILGTSAAFQLGMLEDVGLLIAALVALPVLLRGGRAERLSRHRSLA